MSVTVGIAFAFVAMLCWGFGDFLIQKSARKIGDWETLFIITFVGTLMLAPFVRNGLIDLFNAESNFGIMVLIGCSVVLFVAALFDFEALKIGKITVVEPVWSTEIIVSAFLAYFILKENLGVYQIILIAFLILGLILVSIKERGKFSFKHFFLERGVLIAFGAAVAMGLANFMMGVGARATDPIVANFFVNVVMMSLSLFYLIYRGRLKRTFLDFKNNFKLMITMSISDNLAWVAFAFAMSLAPIGIAVALSESYIIISVILGFVINKEKLQPHQKMGLIFALIGAVTLAAVTTS